MASKGSRAVLEPETEKPAYSNELCISLYTAVLKCRMCDEKARILFRQSKFGGNFYSAVGQEATEVGAAFHPPQRRLDCTFPPRLDLKHNQRRAAEILLRAAVRQGDEPGPRPLFSSSHGLS